MSIGLPELMAGFPFSPSDMVIQRAWAFQVGLFDPDVGTAEDTDFPCRLALEGCKFAGIDRALNYRRYHSGRKRKNLQGRLNDVRCVLNAVSNDARCPPNALILGRLAIKSHLLAIVSMALIQNETDLAQKCIRELAEIDPSVFDGDPSEFVSFLMYESIADQSMDHEPLLRRIFQQLPEEMVELSSQSKWALLRGYLLKGIRAILWDRGEEGQTYFRQAMEKGARIDEDIIQLTVHQLLLMENEFGKDFVIKVLNRINPFFNQIESRSGERLESIYFVNRAFVNYRECNYRGVVHNVFRAWRKDLSCLFNRGVVSIFFRSAIKYLHRNWFYETGLLR